MLTSNCSLSTFMDNYFTSFCLLTHLGINNTGATGVLRKNSLHKLLSLGAKSNKKTNVATLNSKHQAKKAVQL